MSSVSLLPSSLSLPLNSIEKRTSFSPVLQNVAASRSRSPPLPITRRISGTTVGEEVVDWTIQLIVPLSEAVPAL